MSTSKGALENVEALREVRTELESKKQLLNSKLLEELGKQFYIESAREISFKRQGSGRDFQRGNDARNSKGNKTKRALMDMPAFAGQNRHVFFIKIYSLNTYFHSFSLINKLKINHFYFAGTQMEFKI